MLQSFSSFWAGLCVLPSNSHTVHSYAAERASMIYVANTWQPLIRYLLMAGSGDKTSGWGWMLMWGWKHIAFFFPFTPLQYICHIDSTNLHNKEARWSLSLSLPLAFPPYLSAPCSDVAVESFSLSSWHWKRKAISGSLFAFDSDAASQRFIDKREAAGLLDTRTHTKPQMTYTQRPQSKNLELKSSDTKFCFICG